MSPSSWRLLGIAACVEGRDGCQGPLTKLKCPCVRRGVRFRGQDRNLSILAQRDGFRPTRGS
jgi:hypothetical protein